MLRRTTHVVASAFARDGWTRAAGAAGAGLILADQMPSVSTRLRSVSSSLPSALWMSSSSSSSSSDEGTTATTAGTTASFGFRDVDAREKEHLVRGVFEQVAPSYDLMNDLMSAGVHRAWKDYLVSKVGVFPGMTHLDVAGGTGDVAFRVLRALRAAEASARKRGSGGFEPGRVIVSDINPFMLGEGVKRARKLGFLREESGASHGAVDAEMAQLSFVEGNAECLPFEDASVDVYTIAFGLRNVTDTLAALKDAYRLLKPGGRFMCLEFSHVKHEPLRSLYEAYSFNIIPAMGAAVANDWASYQYLVESIRRFPKQDELENMMREAGFKSVSHENITGGVVAIHSGFKL